MKKTLITLAAFTAALSGIAGAATFEVTSGNYNSGGPYTAPSDYTFQFVIPEGMDMTSAWTLLAYINGGNTGNIDSDKNRQISFCLENGTTPGLYFLNVIRSNMADDTKSLKEGSSSTYFSKLDANVVYTLSAVADGNYSTITLTGEGYTTATKKLDSQIVCKSDFSAGVPLNSFLDDRFVPASDAVPEPATATLSLLALAGLAGRRRRK